MVSSVKVFYHERQRAATTRLWRPFFRVHSEISEIGGSSSWTSCDSCFMDILASEKSLNVANGVSQSVEIRAFHWFSENLNNSRWKKKVLHYVHVQEERHYWHPQFTELLKNKTSTSNSGYLVKSVWLCPASTVKGVQLLVVCLQRPLRVKRPHTILPALTLWLHTSACDWTRQVCLSSVSQKSRNALAINTVCQFWLSHYIHRVVKCIDR
jgi:hypothetical protein